MRDKNEQQALLLDYLPTSAHSLPVIWTVDELQALFNRSVDPAYCGQCLDLQSIPCSWTVQMSNFTRETADEARCLLGYQTYVAHEWASTIQKVELAKMIYCEEMGISVLFFVSDLTLASGIFKDYVYEESSWDGKYQYRLGFTSWEISHLLPMFPNTAKVVPLDHLISQL